MTTRRGRRGAARDRVRRADRRRRGRRPIGWRRCCGAPHSAGATCTAALFATATVPAQVLDVWRRKDLPGPAPVLIFVPGGAWVHGSRMLQGYALMTHLAEQGWVCLSVDYRVSPHHRWPPHITDVKAAVAWARANVDRFGGDRDFVAIAGCSAGGHLAALTGLTPDDPDFHGRSARRRRHLRRRGGRHLRPLRLGGQVHAGARPVRRLPGARRRQEAVWPGTRRCSARPRRSRGCTPTLRRSWSFTAPPTPSSRSRRPELRRAAARGVAFDGRLRGAARAPATAST